MDTYGTDPNSHSPALALMPCNGSAAQTFELQSDETLRRTSDGLCVDITFCGNDPCSGLDLELYACGSPHHNQVGVMRKGLVGWAALFCGNLLNIVTSFGRNLSTTTPLALYAQNLRRRICA